jgi:hypothetical protein
VAAAAERLGVQTFAGTRSRQRVGHNVIRLSESRGIVVEEIVALYAERALTTAALAAYVDAPPEVREARQLAQCQASCGS